MIFYFTGTGNSLWLANELKKVFDEELISIPEQLKKNKNVFSLNEQEMIFFVYPVHSWGPPSIVKQFISTLKLENHTNQSIYSVCTCGDDCGYTTSIIEKALRSKGYYLTYSYSVTMPNNYTLFPGFDVDNKENEQKKLKDAPLKVDLILEAIKGRKDKNLYTTGTWPFLKSRIINPLFINFVLGKNSFHINDKCISCGLCERICPTHTIRMIDKYPVWSDNCIQCLGCLNRCPSRAIDYGKITLNKGRYHHPDIK